AARSWPLDADVGVLERARARYPGVAIDWRGCGEIFDLHPTAGHSFDAVLSVATLHHMDAAAGLTRFAELVRPGGHPMPRPTPLVPPVTTATLPSRSIFVIVRNTAGRRIGEMVSDCRGEGVQQDTRLFWQPGSSRDAASS